VVRIEAARVRQHPQARAGQALGLRSERRLRPIEGDAIRADADDRDDSRTVAPDFPLEPVAARAKFLGFKFVGADGGAPH
jgi:hypothetical protein